MCIIDRVIETRMIVIGSGTNDDPWRTLVQYWTEHGDLLATVDPCNPTPFPTSSAEQASQAPSQERK